MRFDDPALQSALEAWRRDPEIRERACADNMRFEERVSLPRRVAFETEVGVVENADQLRRAHILYVRTFMETRGATPHTFGAELGPARLSAAGVDPYLKIVRLESLARVFSVWATRPGVAPLEFLREAIAKGDTGVTDGFLAAWNDPEMRDHRPAFAAWKHQLSTELDSGDWPHALRDRLGLGHHDGSKGAIPVARMEYRVSDVLHAAGDAGIGDPFTVPTALDIRPGPYFFPSPGALPYGRAMSLIPILSDDDLLAEMLHVRLPYRREHIAELGTIDRAPPVHDL